MSLATRPRHRAAEIGTAARTITRRAPVTLTLVRHRAQPTAATIVRLTITALFAYLLALPLPNASRPVIAPLRLVTQAGFGPEFLDYFAVVEDVHSACGRAARQGAQTAVGDVRADPGFRPHREIAAAAGFRAVQSTPLVDYAGHLIGMVSTHFRRPHRPSDRDLRIMELYADFAGEALTAHLGRPSGDGPADPVGRAMVTALLDPARVREADVSVPFELWVMGRMTVSFARRAGRCGPSAQPV